MNNLAEIQRKIFPAAEVFLPVLEEWKQAGESVVFTNGCFDLVHRGHVEYLAKASQLGNRLIIGLNSDKSVSALKGYGRPLVDEKARAILLAAMFFVDAVILFDEETPEKMIAALLPHFLVKGKDYRIEEIAGSKIVADKGGKVETIDLSEGFSTSALIEKIRKLWP
ncbi:MAG: D-glycero-beta-D-manno-heptose 1-phosphate adenylyltransferase [Prolixibacteraceae bacterium]|nr:D-glycero-beta-D-manno-heptose 1-phosphate adenylyltransferase [Prolixibacteraceae bacterium]